MILVEKLFRNIFFLIDDVIFNQIPKLYDLLISIARTSPLSQANISDMASRIYKLLAVFMVFKVTLSLIMYIVNPDDFSDKSKGVSKLITNIVISLATLVLTPYIFSYAYQFQKIILEDNSIATLVFGKEIGSSDSILTNAGDQMAYLSISPFITPNLTKYDCSNVYNISPDGNTELNEACFGFTDVDNYALNSDLCSGEMALCTSKTLDRDDLINYAAGIKNKNFNYIFRKDLVLSYYDGKFDFDYSFIMSTVVGVIIALFLITSCMDIALRSIKLAFLQLIAPIPILSYIDPKGGKDGMFKKWYQMCFKTYLLLFIKVFIIYFAIYVIGNLNRIVDIVDASYITNGYIKIFILIGVLMFAKNFTKILESLGVKLDGGFQLNPFKKMENEALGMKKPAAFANKVAKGILTSPVSGLQTLGKKTIGGIDAARNGKGFKQGWDRTHGNLHNKFYKKLDEWAPDSAESRKNERIGRESINLMDEKAKFGADVYRRAGGDGSKGLPKLFRSNEYRRSYEAMDNEKKAMYAAQAKGERERTDIQEQLKRGLITGEAADEAFKRINKEVGTAEKRYNVANKRHEEMKKIYAGDAKIEDAFDYYDKTTSQIDKDILLGKKPAEPVTQQNNQNQQRNKQYTADNQNLNDQSSTTNSESTESPDIDTSTNNDSTSNSESTESPDIDTSTNNDSTSNSEFQPLYDSIDRDIDAALKDLEQSVNNSGTPSGEKMYDGAAERRKKIDEEKEKLIAEYYSLGDSASDTIRKNEIRRLIEELDRQK